MLAKEQETRLNNDIKATMELMVRNGSSFGLLQTLNGDSPFEIDNRYESLYTNATEDMATYHKIVGPSKSVLTIGASGEQTVNAILTGAKVVDVYDSNKLCRHAVHLRIAAIKALTLDEFNRYYKTFDPFLFVRISDYLNEEELMYWGTLYSMYGPTNLNGGRMLETLLFTYKRLDEDLIKKINPYLNPENYKKLQEILKKDDVKVNYIDSDLYSLPKHLEGKSYDFINLSNIYEYLNYSDNVRFKYARKYRNFVMNEMLPHLNLNGTMLISYLYAWNDALDKDFAKMYEKSKSHIVSTGAITLDKYLYYLQGLTTQNLAYHYLFEAFKEDDVEKVPTEHVAYGQSKDMSHDCALIIRKK